MSIKKNILLILMLILVSCSNPESENQSAINLSLIKEPEERPSVIPEFDPDFPFRFTDHRYWWAPFSARKNVGSSIAPGWGYMDPMVVVNGSDVYEIMYFSCDAKVKKYYCIYLMKNGEIFSDLHAMGLDLIPEMFQTTYSYQPPMIFLNKDTIYMAYESGKKGGGSLLNLVSINLNGLPPHKWRHRSTYDSGDSEFNYLGGASSVEGIIYIAGLGSKVSSGPSLELIRIQEPYEEWENKVVVHKFHSNLQIPVYPHVQVRKSGEIEILTTLHNSSNCDEDGQYFSESYKTVISFKGKYGELFSEYWKDASSDVTSQNPGGDSCLFHKQRFPMAQFYDSKNDIVYSIIKSSEIFDVVPEDRTGSNANLIRKFVLYANDQVVVSDLSEKVRSYFENPNDIWSISGTLLENGTLVFAAANDGLIPALSDIAFFTSKNLSTFTNMYRLPTTDLPEHSIHFAQNSKNGSTLIDKLYFFHSGSVYGSLNFHHRYHFYVAEPVD